MSYHPDLHANRHAARERNNEAALRSRDIESDDPRPGAFTNDEVADGTLDDAGDKLAFDRRPAEHDGDFGV